jgi:hypothetical protein
MTCIIIIIIIILFLFTPLALPPPPPPCRGCWFIPEPGLRSDFSAFLLKIYCAYPSLHCSDYQLLQYCRALVKQGINPLSPELNPICHLLALLVHDILHVSRIRVKSLTLRLLMSFGAPIRDVSRSHTTTQHSR